MAENKLDPALVADAADRFVRYAVAGLAVQGDLADADAARLLLRALARWFGIDFRTEAERAEELALDLEDVEKRSGGRHGS